MSNDSTLFHLAEQCGRHTALYKQRKPHNPEYCHKLFELALKERDQRAWELLYDNYKPQLERWAQRHAQFKDCDEEAEYFVNRAFERMWRAVTPEKFENFPNLAPVLSYLQMCIGAAIQDHNGKKKPLIDESGSEYEVVSDNKSLDTAVISQEFWHCVNAHIRTTEEELFVRGHFIWGLKPRQLCDEFPETFDDPKAVNRVRTSFLNRFKRNVDKFLECIKASPDDLAYLS